MHRVCTGPALGTLRAQACDFFLAVSEKVRFSARGVFFYSVGRLLVARREEAHGNAPLRFDVPASGVYLVKIGTLAARKVVVMR